MLPGHQSKSSSNGFTHKRGEREGDWNKAQSIKSQSANTPSTAFSGEAACMERPSRDRLVYLTTCKIGHLVEVHMKNGSVYSGIFHAADVEKDFGIILKMASLIREGTLRGPKSRYEVVRKPPSKTFIIPADEVVQVVAKDLSVSSDGLLNAAQSEKQMELLTDSSISRSCHVDQRRELKPWVPDEDAPQNLVNVFDNPGDRGWDQFHANESLYGVKSTYNEEFYTTKLERGPRTKELEEQAMRIAREIEGENTRDLHVAEERGFQLNAKFDIDEETKYSAVRPVDGFDDSGFDEEDDKMLDTCNDRTFGGSSTSESQPCWNNPNVDQSCSMSDDHARHLTKEYSAQGGSISERQLGERRNNNSPEVSHSNKSPQESVSDHGDVKEGAKLGSGATSGSKERERQVSGKTKLESSFGQSASRSSGIRPAPSTPSRPGLSPSSSIGSLSSSEKSTLNPNAKEFKLNPNAKSFKPSQPAGVRPQSPMADSSFYYPAGPVQQMPGMPVGYGIQPQYPGQQQQIMYHHPQTYYPPNAQHQYPPPQQQQQQQQMMQNQQMMMHGQPRLPLVYMPPPPPPPYHPENPYNQGRE